MENQQGVDGEPKDDRADKPAAAKKSPLLKTVLIFIVLTVIIAAAVLLFTGRELSGVDPLMLVRRDTVLLISYDYLASHKSGKRLSETYSRWKNTDPFRQAKSLLALRTGLDADEDFLSWAGPRFCIAAGADRDSRTGLNRCLSEFPLVLIASVRDAEKLRETMDRIKRLYREKNGSDYREERYRGIEVNIPDQKGFIHFSHCRQYFIVSTNKEGLKKAIDTLQTPAESIAVSKNYRDFCSRLAKPRELTFYCNVKQWRSESAMAEALNQNLLKKVDNLGFAVIREKDAILLDGILISPGSAPDSNLTKISSASGLMSLPRFIPGELPFTMMVNSSSIPLVDALYSLISPGQSAGLRDLFEKVSRTVASKDIDVKPSDLSGEMSISVDIVAFLKQSLLEKRKVLDDGGPVPALLALGLRDDPQKALISKFRIDERKHLGSRYKDYRLFSKNGLAFLALDRFVFISLDGSEDQLRRIIDTQSLPTLSMEKSSFYSQSSTEERAQAGQVKSPELFLLYLSFNDIAPLLGFYSAVKPEAKGIAHFVNTYRGIWIRVSMGSDCLRARILLEGTGH
jgi:hypothetical protein